MWSTFNLIFKAHLFYSKSSSSILFPLETLMQGALNRIPSIEKAEIRQFLNGPESFTPDGNLLFGEVPEVNCVLSLKFMQYYNVPRGMRA